MSPVYSGRTTVCESYRFFSDAGEIPVFNITKGDIVRMTWGEVLRQGTQYAYEYPLDAGLWYPNGSIRTNKLVHYFVVFWLQMVPAFLIDGIMILTRQKTL